MLEFPQSITGDFLLSRTKIDPKRENPISAALGILRQVREVTDEVLVGFSGGKDSWCVLELAIQVFGVENVHPYFMYFLPDLRCEQEGIERLYRRHPLLPPVIRVPHFDAIRAIRSGAFGNPQPIKNLTPKDTERIVRGRSSVGWILLGHRLTDSLHRRGLLTSCGGIEVDFRRAYPIMSWHPQDVISFLASKGIPLPPSFGSGRHQTSNVGLTFECLFFLRENYPDDYSRILKVFPKAVQILQREEVRARHQIYYEPKVEGEASGSYLDQAI